MKGVRLGVIWPMQAKSEEPSLAEWQSEINKHQRELGAMQTALPSSVNLGLTALQLGKVSDISISWLLLYLLTPSTPRVHAYASCPGIISWSLRNLVHWTSMAAPASAASD